MLQNTMRCLYKAKYNEVCLYCKRVVNEKEKGVNCDYCARWFHATCEDINETQYEFIEKMDKCLAWQCMNCRIKLDQRNKEIEKNKTKAEEYLDVQINIHKRFLNSEHPDFESLNKNLKEDGKGIRYDCYVLRKRIEYATLLLIFCTNDCQNIKSHLSYC